MRPIARATLRTLLPACVLLAPVAVHAQRPRPAVSAQGDDRSVERTLFKLENDWAQAVIRRDAGALRRLVAPRWVYSDESGVMEREAGIKAFTTGADTVREASNSRMRAFVYPGAAIVIGVLEMRGSGPSGRFVRRYRYTDSWAYLDGRWQCIASQDYLLPERRRPR